MNNEIFAAGEDRTFPIHCIVEQEDDNLADSSSTARCVCDMYVVLPGSTLFRDLTRSALAQLSFPTSDMLAASGMFHIVSILILNWLFCAVDLLCHNRILPLFVAYFFWLCVHNTFFELSI